MPSPFPGMDPYLEGGSWPSFHLLFIAEVLGVLSPRIRPKYIVEAERRVYLETDPHDPERFICRRSSRCLRPTTTHSCHAATNARKWTCIHGRFASPCRQFPSPWSRKTQTSFSICRRCSTPCTTGRDTTIRLITREKSSHRLRTRRPSGQSSSSRSGRTRNNSQLFAGPT